MLNPRVRAKRLQAELDRVRALHDRAGLFAIESTAGDPPDRYIFRFTCLGIAQIVGDEPVYANDHHVAILLTDTYPTTAPYLEWLTPIFHPNISADGRGVCIGSWYPAKTLDHLVLMLGEMIQYRNYASHDPLNLEASLWAMAHKDLFPVEKRLLLDPDRESHDAPAAGHIEPEINLL